MVGGNSVTSVEDVSHEKVFNIEDLSIEDQIRYLAKDYEVDEKKLYAFKKVVSKWDIEQWEYFDDLVIRESNWKSDAQNLSSSAFGLGQFLDSTWDYVGCEKTTEPKKQIDCMINYIEIRYHNPKNAILFHNKNNYY